MLSASQISRAELCLRKWAWRFLAKKPDPPDKYRQHGIDTHEQVAAWLTRKIPPPVGSSAAAIIPHLPPPQIVDPNCVEVRFTLDLDGIDFVGYVDLRHNETVYDHKTCSDLKWAIAPEQLRHDTQATLYAYETGLSTVELQWTYATRTRPRALVVRAEVTKEDIQPRIEKTIETARTLQEILEERPSVLDLPYDAQGCEAYGGCPYRELCNLTPKEQMRSIMSQGAKEDFLAKLKARKMAATGMLETAPKAAINPPAPPPEPEPETAINVEVEVEEPKPKKRGRPRKKPQATIPSPPPVPSSVPITARGVLPTGYTLYVDCAPVKGVANVEHAVDRIGRVMLALCQEAEVAHYKFLEGKTPGAFSTAIAKDLAENPPKGAVVLNTKYRESVDCLVAFELAAAVVVYGWS